MDNFIKKISNVLSLVVVFCFSAIIYFNYKGFVYENGKIELRKQEAVAAEMNGIATVLPRDIVINTSQKYSYGSSSAPLTLFEYSSLGCPHCADFHLDVIPDLMKEYVDKGLLRIVFVNFPLDKNSMKAAMLSKCMMYDNFLPFIEAMFSAQRSWWMNTDEEHLFRYAAEHGLSYDEAVACVKDKKLAQEIVADRQEAIDRLKVQGTPAFYVAGADGNEIIYGSTSYRNFKNYIDSRLERLGYVKE
ncbi:MAG: DsbA family protein [Alphaproteobacteria bacterium]|nr:DsbA family protein [Alphaproteobacteria bacterium]